MGLVLRAVREKKGEGSENWRRKKRSLEVTTKSGARLKAESAHAIPGENEKESQGSSGENGKSALDFVLGEVRKIGRWVHCRP